jgi:hypothetical protein
LDRPPQRLASHSSITRWHTSLKRKHLHISLTIPSHTALGQTVDTTIGNTPARVTLITEGTLRIEPNELCTIFAATTEGGQTTNLCGQ